VVVPDTRVALALASAAFFGDPSQGMDLVGVTGTNGKTTSAYIIDSILRAAGRTTGLIGTVETRIAGAREPASRTTPESRDLQALLAHMLEEGVDAAVMEVSSHAIDLHRVDGVTFAVAAFTNLSQDHLDYHPSIEEYFSVKTRLFCDMPVGARVVNVDDAYGRRLVEQTGAEWTVGVSPGACVRAEGVRMDPRSTSFELVTPQGTVSVRLPLTGAFNVSNALVAAGCGAALGIPLATIAAGLEAAPQVPGRLERIDAGQ
jgi:UDP-N-acetylmuramoyl-L-alanyl-D-glutamate--2,6-diaminopimelate ligase